MGEVITFAGLYAADKGQAAAVTFYTFVGENSAHLRVRSCLHLTGFASGSELLPCHWHPPVHADNACMHACRLQQLLKHIISAI
jgi:hypothetical protein